MLMTAEVVGRVAWFAVFAGLGRTQGEAAVGTFVFAAALVQIAILGLDLGLDRYLIRTIAKEWEERHTMASDIVALKLALSIPVTLSLVLFSTVMGYEGTTQITILILSFRIRLGITEPNPLRCSDRPGSRRADRGHCDGSAARGCRAGHRLTHSWLRGDRNRAGVRIRFGLLDSRSGRS